MTETVEETRRLAPDAMSIRLGCQSSATSDRFQVSPWGWLPSLLGRASLYVLSRDVIRPNEDLRHPFALSALRSTAAGLAAGEPPDEGADQPSEMIRLPLRDGEAISYWWSVGRPEPVGTPAGTFTGCYPLTELYGNDSHWTHWLCPGVGFARHEEWACTSFSGAAVVYELVRYHLPPIVPEP